MYRTEFFGSTDCTLTYLILLKDNAWRLTLGKLMTEDQLNLRHKLITITSKFAIMIVTKEILDLILS